jgi:hypothetical protein
MTEIEKNFNHEFDGPAIYCITIRGRIGKSYSEHLGGMQIVSQSRANEPPLTIIHGEVLDRAQLLEIMNAVFDLNMTILSVDKVS